MQALSQGTVDAVGAYANNEPVQLKLAGKDINEIKVWEFAKLVGNGVATNEATIKNRPDLVRRFVRALMQGIADSIANPDDALQTTVAAIPDAGGANLKASQAVLNASIPLWKNTHIGESRAEDWSAMEKFMREAGFIQQDVNVQQAFTNEFVQ
jgi:NitT/TauT family transport system substrate-binding protein